MTAIVNVILKSVLSACLGIIVLRIAVWPVEILGYATKSRVTVTEVAWQAGKETCVRMVNMCLKRCISNNKCIMYNVYVCYVQLLGLLCLFGKSAKLKQSNIPLHIVIIVYQNSNGFVCSVKVSKCWWKY